MAESKREYRQLVMHGLRKAHPEGDKDVNELQGAMDGLMPRSGGSMSGGFYLEKLAKRPDAQKNAFALYVYKSGNDPLKLWCRDENGKDTVLASV